MFKLRRLVVVAAGAAAISALVPALGFAAKPVVHEHVNFTSDPYEDNLCGLEVTAVDDVVENFRQDESGAILDNVNLTTTYTAANGKSVQFHQANTGKVDPPIDNGDGTLTVIAKV